MALATSSSIGRDRPQVYRFVRILFVDAERIDRGWRAVRQHTARSSARKRAVKDHRATGDYAAGALTLVNNSSASA